MSSVSTFQSYPMAILRALSNEKTWGLANHIKDDVFPAYLTDLIKFVPMYLMATGQKEVKDFNDLSRAFLFVQSGEKLKADYTPEQVREFCAAVQKHVEDGTPVPVDQLLQTYIDMSYAERITKAYLMDSGRTRGMSTFDKISGLVEQYMDESLVTKRSVLAEITPIEEDDDFSNMVRTGMEWPWDGFNELIGPLEHELIAVCSRPDGGKTTFLTQIGWNFARQFHEQNSDKKVLFFNNEEAMPVIRRRFIRSVLGMTARDIAADPIAARDKYRSIVGDSIVFVDNVNSVAKIEQVLAKYEPGLIIIDQLYKINARWLRAEIEAERFRMLAEWSRNLAKAYCPVFFTNQLDGSADNELYPSMSSLYLSKTGLQGEVDALIMIGCEVDKIYDKCFHTPKNKLTGIKDKSVRMRLDLGVSRYVEQ